MAMIKLFALKLRYYCRSKILLLLFCILLLVMHFYNAKTFNYEIYDNSVIPEGYLVWNSKCYMLSKNPFDPSIMKFIKKERYENCSMLPLLTSIIQDKNGRNLLILKTNESEHLQSVYCCWSPIIRPVPKKPKPADNFDSSSIVKNCIDFNSSVILPKDVDTLMVTCKDAKGKINVKNHKSHLIIYQNVHYVINVEKVMDRFNVSNDRNVKNRRKKLSVLLLGLDNVSRLNFYRNLPKTVDYLDKKGWLLMKGYNKMGENTFPNLMAILSGQNQTEAIKKCNPTVPFSLDYCPMLWYNFKSAGYITAYAEDEAGYSTFNWLKVGFVDPPTDYYLRTYIIASEKLLKTRTRFGNNYCTGPELATERILNSAVDFAIRFQGRPNFGFFWTNSITHNSINGLSLMDSQIFSRLEHLEREGVMNNTMIIILSDHGMRIGEFRKTFIGWYEERLPVFYVWLPKCFRDENPEAYQALTVNQNRLTSPFDLYETLRDIVIRAGGDAGPSTGCPKCQSLFKTVPMERGCEDVGVPTHWCVCTSFIKDNASSQFAVQGAHKILEHIDHTIQDYKTTTGKRLCAKFNFKKIHKFYRVLNLGNNSTSSKEYYYMIELSPGNAKFEATVHYYGSGKYYVNDEEIIRLDSYQTSSKCLNNGLKRYCHCIQ